MPATVTSQNASVKRQNVFVTRKVKCLNLRRHVTMPNVRQVATNSVAATAKKVQY